MHDIEPYAIALTIAALALLAAVGSSRISAHIGVPAPAIFLLAASIAAEAFPHLGGLSITADQRIVTVALVVILFDGGMGIGRRRFRSAAGAIAWIGVAGTFVTAGGLALAAHGLFGFDWRAALLVGTALAPTDPAVVFSVLGGRQISGRSGTLLEGESGANDPVGIALMISVLGAGGGDWGAVGHGAAEFALQMLLGVAFGLAGAAVLLWTARRLALRNEALHAIYVLGFALLVYGVATACHGSGFLAVFLVGILVGDEHLPFRREVRHVVGTLASLGEIVAFVVLGLSLPIGAALGHGRVWTGLGLAALLILLVRPLLVGALLVPVRLRLDERAFVLWAGLKGAVPILLGTYVVSEHVHGAERIYGVIFVVVLVSVIVQGGLVPALLPDQSRLRRVRARWSRDSSRRGSGSQPGPE